MQPMINKERKNVEALYYNLGRIRDVNNKLFGQALNKVTEAKLGSPEASGLMYELDGAQHAMSDALEELANELYRLEQGLLLNENGSAGAPANAYR